MSELSRLGRETLERELRYAKANVSLARERLEKAQGDVVYWTERLERDEARAIELSLDLAE